MRDSSIAVLLGFLVLLVVFGLGVVFTGLIVHAVVYILHHVFGLQFVWGFGKSLGAGFIINIFRMIFKGGK